MKEIIVSNVDPNELISLEVVNQSTLILINADLNQKNFWFPLIFVKKINR